MIWINFDKFIGLKVIKINYIILHTQWVRYHEIQETFTSIIKHIIFFLTSWLHQSLIYSLDTYYI